MSLGYNYGSPGIKITENETNQTIMGVASSIGALVGNFNWGPCESVTVVPNEATLVSYFGLPDDFNYKDWMTALNYLSYSQDLRLVRCISRATTNACDVPAESIQIKSYDNFVGLRDQLIGTDKTAKIFARYPGSKGNGLKVVIADKSTLDANPTHVLQPYINQLLDDQSIAIAIYDNGSMHEFGIYSLDKNALTYSGLTNYFFNAVNIQSTYIYLVAEKFFTYSNIQVPNPDYDGDPGQNNSPTNIPEFITQQVRNPIDINVSLSGANDGGITTGDYIRAWDQFADPDISDVSLLMQGGAPETVGNYMITSIAAIRKDCIACVSPQINIIVGQTNQEILSGLINSSENLGYSGFRFMDGNYKFQYDKYNDVYRWVPMNGDMAGLFAQTDSESAPWFSPGLKQIQNAEKLAFYPTKTERDEMFKYRINPITRFNDTGTVLYGDWTGSPISKADNFVNVRRMLNYVEKSIANYARTMLFQQNDDLSAQKFIQTVEPFLRDVQGGRGIRQYQIIADSSVNTPSSQDSGIFYAIVRIRPIFSIRYVEINFEIIRGRSIDFTETYV